MEISLFIVYLFSYVLKKQEGEYRQTTGNGFIIHLVSGIAQNSYLKL